jgi:LDH2 family malate/lactate/ureidoglycolate dehydrogenase
MFEILCATPTSFGSAMREIGHFFLVLDPAAFRTRNAFQDDLEDLLARIRANTPAAPTDPVLILRDPEHDTTEQRRRDGIPIVHTLVEEVRTVCEESRAKFLLS